MTIINKPQSKSAQAQAKAKEALAVFNKALTNLVAIQEDVEKSKQSVANQIVELETEKANLNETSKQLSTKISKIKEIVE